MYILSQILVVISDGCYMTSMLSKNKMKMIIFLLLSDLLFGSHYFCLGALTGAIIVYIDALFLIVTFLIEKFGDKKYVPIAVMFAMLAVVLTTIFTYVGAISILPMASMLIYLFGMMLGNLIAAKAGAMIRNILNIIYMILITSYLGAALEFILMLSALAGTILVIKSKINKNLK